MNILITGVGGPTPRSIVHSLKHFSAYKAYRFVGTDINPVALGLYQENIFDRTYLIPRANDPRYWDFIGRIIEQHRIDLAIVQPELEVLEWSKRSQTHQLPCKAILPDYRLARILYNKATMAEILEPDHLAPKSVRVTPNSIPIDRIKSEIGFPFWVRSAQGSSGLGSLKIEDQAVLESWIKINSDVDEFQVSEYLPGRNLACKLLYFEGKFLRAAVAERLNYIMSNVAPSGITGNTSYGLLLNDESVVEIAQKAMELLMSAASAAKHGCFTVDLKEDAHGNLKVTEINVRMVAFNGCLAAAGANFSEDIVRLLDCDTGFDDKSKIYKFEEGTVFLRDVDAAPVLMNQADLLTLS